MKDDENKKRRSSVSERPKSNWDNQTKQEEEKKQAEKQSWRKQALKTLKGLNMLTNAAIGKNNLQIGIATTGIALGLAQGEGKEEPKKWYQKAWSAVVGGVNAAYKAVTGNVATIAITGLALAAGVANWRSGAYSGRCCYIGTKSS
ncbi:hypothetical protein [Candidatus Trichorickettsia mobilis]|jgi:hypothetical protein|uniref:hypothetical protein n=1 Tax=Candidatus Trichorickettsia mobilis TaxID=1346319 RepID=UPI00292D12AE|nr:hypothetical protein [Candidatus Trichorickettsia mobilis]